MRRPGHTSGVSEQPARGRPIDAPARQRLEAGNGRGGRARGDLAAAGRQALELEHPFPEATSARAEAHVDRLVGLARDGHVLAAAPGMGPALHAQPVHRRAGHIALPEHARAAGSKRVPVIAGEHAHRPRRGAHPNGPVRRRAVLLDNVPPEAEGAAEAAVRIEPGLLLHPQLGASAALEVHERAAHPRAARDHVQHRPVANGRQRAIQHPGVLVAERVRHASAPQTAASRSQGHEQPAGAGRGGALARARHRRAGARRPSPPARPRTAARAFRGRRPGGRDRS